MIDHHTWRSLIYRLAEEYPDCLMLNFTIKLISDAGFQSEITSISTAAQQIEVFSRVLKTAITKFLSSPDDVHKTIEECAVSIQAEPNMDHLCAPYAFTDHKLYFHNDFREWSAMVSIRMYSVKYLSRCCPRSQKEALI